MSNDNNQKGGGGNQKAVNGLSMGVAIDPENMNSNKLAGVAGISGVMFLAAIGLNKLMPVIRRRLFGISDEDAKKASEAVAPDKAFSVVLGALTGEGGAAPLKMGNLRYLAKCLGPALAKAQGASQQPDKDLQDSQNALQKALDDFKAGTSAGNK